MLVLLILLVNMFILDDVFAATNPYKKSSRFGTNCTWYAWDQAYRKAGVALPGWGNADTWLNYAKKAGYSTGTTPKAKSIVVWKWSSYGHVGYVEKVVGDKIYVWDSQSSCIDENDPEFVACNSIIENMSEQGYNKCVKDYGKPIACEYPAGYWQTPGDLIGYIYLDNAPKASNSKKTTVKKTTAKKTTTTTKAKSNNSYLSSLVVDNLEFEFDKEKFLYELNVKNEVCRINIDATAEDNLSTVQGFGEQELAIGENVIEIIVTAEDETTSTYTLKVIREEKVTTTKKTQEKKNNNQLNDYIFIGALIGLGILVSIITVLVIRKK